MRYVLRHIRWLAETARQMVGVPSYEGYRQHMAQHHPGREPMTEREFFRNRQEARYGGRGAGRCC